MRLGLRLAEIRGWKALLVIIAIVAVGSLVAAIPLLRGDQPSDNTQLVTAVAYTGTGTTSAGRVDIEVADSKLDQQLGRDWIYPIYQPTFIPWSEADFDDQTYVIGLALNGEAKAYPVDILAYREMVNDVVGGVPVLVTW